jgi:hypothetical protein
VILVDSTVWIDLLRTGSGKPVARLRDLLESSEAAVAPVIVQEILQGAASQESLERLREHFLSLPMRKLVPLESYEECRKRSFFVGARCHFAFFPKYFGLLRPFPQSVTAHSMCRVAAKPTFFTRSKSVSL